MEVDALSSGIAYCFLPLPIQTGLAVMVNGFFELSSNRRDIWQSGTDMTGDGKTRAEWNVALMTDVIAPSYLRLLLRARNLFKEFNSKYQSLWPTASLAMPWLNVSKATLQLAKQERLLFTDFKSNGGVSVINTIINTSITSLFTSMNFVGNQNTLSSIGDQWIQCDKSIIFPDQFSSVVVTNADEDILAELIIDRSKLPLVRCCENIRKGLLLVNSFQHLVSPPFVRKLLRNLIEHKLLASNENFNMLSEEQQLSVYDLLPESTWCRFLLKFCISDCGSNSALDDLNSLPLLPLFRKGLSAVGTLKIFNLREVGALQELSSMGFPLSYCLCALMETNFNLSNACSLLASTMGTLGGGIIQSPVYRTLKGNMIFVICNDPQEIDLFQDAAFALIDKSKIDPNELKYLLSEKIQKHSNVRSFSPNLIPDLLRCILPQICFSGCKFVNYRDINEIGPILNFLKRFYDYCCTRAEVVKAVAELVAIVPTTSQKLLSLSKVSALVVINGNCSKQLEDFLVLLGCNIVNNTIVFPVENGIENLSIQNLRPLMPSKFWNYVYSVDSVSEIIDAFGVLSRANSSSDNVWLQKFEIATALQKDELRLFIANGCNSIRFTGNLFVNTILIIAAYLDYHS